MLQNMLLSTSISKVNGDLGLFGSSTGLVISSPAAFGQDIAQEAVGHAEELQQMVQRLS